MLCLPVRLISLHFLCDFSVTKRSIALYELHVTEFYVDISSIKCTLNHKSRLDAVGPIF